MDRAELLRATLSDIDAAEKAVLRLLRAKQHSHKDRVLIDHKVNNLLRLSQRLAARALAQAEEGEADRREVNSSQAWSSFYEGLRSLQENPVGLYDPAQDFSSEDSLLNLATSGEFALPRFSEEEDRGRFVDMHRFYLLFINLAPISESRPPGDYIWYLQRFDKFDEIPHLAKKKCATPYLQYLRQLENYLIQFLIKVQPFADYSRFRQELERDFESLWLQEKAPGQKEVIQLNKQSIYCDTCDKYFSANSSYIGHLSGKKHEKAAAASKRPAVNLDKAIMLAQFKIIRVKDLLGNWVYDSINLARRKQTKDYRQESEEEPAEEESEIESEEQVANPKNLPLGWDGKPIPLWLYKMHGLDIEFKCEICGNYSYWGRQAFERHFMEWRHNYGMKCLKLPNTVHFRNITSINDALNLHAKLLQESERFRFDAEHEEEFQDQEGNLLSRRLRDDLVRQGLL